MSIGYNPNLPNPPNDPADDVSFMQQNSSAIAQIIAVDHTPFSTNGSGQHMQITFNSNNVPGGFSLPILFTNTQDGAGNNLPGSLPQLFFYANSAPASQNQYLAARNGSTLLTCGIIMKWGQANFSGASTSAAVTFPVAFPNNVFMVVVSNTGFGNASTWQSLTTSGFTCVRGAGGGAGQGFSYIAIGN